MESPIPLLNLAPCQTLSELLLRGARSVDPGQPILLGTIGDRFAVVGLGAFRAVILDVTDALNARGLRSGDTVCLIRLPRTSELLLAIAYAAMTAMGLRVLLPMYTERAALRRWLEATKSRAVVWAGDEARHAGSEADRLRLERLEGEIRSAGVPMLCMEGDLGIGARLREPPSPVHDDPRVARLLASADPDAECLILTTSGTSGEARLVRYRQRALLNSCASWQAAGLFDPERQGGRGLCLLFSHSMGVRAFWNAIWTAQPVCLIPPEWFLEHPERVVPLLREMQPEHVTGGPGVFWTLLELVRVFPDLKHDGLASLRCAISTGAAPDPTLVRRIRESLGIELHNAFGTTETMQISSSLVGDSAGPSAASLGTPLPGVRLALEPLDGPDDRLRLLVHAPFTHAGTVDAVAAESPYWYATGDLVRRSPDGLLFAGREVDECAKDSFGVKLPRSLVMGRYAALGSPVLHVECFPLREEPGLGAVVYAEVDGGHARDPIPTKALLERIRGLIEARHGEQLLEMDDLELRHRTIARFVCVAGVPPRTSKGTVARAAIEHENAETLDTLLGRHVSRPWLMHVDREQLLRSRSTRFVRPRLGEVLRLLRLDKDFVSGNGDRVQMREKAGTREVIDFVGGFGTTLLGHNHPAIAEAAVAFLRSGSIATADQGSDRLAEGALAERLAERIGRSTGRSYIVRFGSTGAEAVEMALAHAYLEREEKLRRFLRNQRRLFGGSNPERVEAITRAAEAAIHAAPLAVLTIAGSYHGTSLGARAVSALPKSRRIFAAMTAHIEAIALPPDGSGDTDAIVRDAEITVAALAMENGRVVESEMRFSRIVCAIAEPVRGEGGIAVVEPRLLQRLASFEFPLVLDEIQCGLGRCGSFLASHGVSAPYYLLGKALGGGVAKISAVLIDRARYCDRFDEDYNGTFAGDALSCTIASAALDVIERDDVPGRARDRGGVLRDRMESIRGDFPDVISQVTGTGLMLGISLAPRAARESALLRAAVDSEHLGLVASSYLLNRWGVRVLPSLSAPNTLRVEPSAYVDDPAISALESGLRALCRALSQRDLSEILGFLVEEEMGSGESTAPEAGLVQFSGVIEPPAPHAVRIAFLNHFIHPERELACIEPSLASMPRSARRALFHRLAGLMDGEPFVLFARNLFGGKVWFASIILPIDAAMFEEAQRSGRRDFPVQRIQESLELGHRLGCSIGGLGAYTSILTDDGTTLKPPAGMTLATGNSLTAAVGSRRLLRVARRCGLDIRAHDTRLGILGAGGNIGGALARRLTSGDEAFRNVLLVGRSQLSLDDQAAALRRSSQSSIECATSLDALRDCNVIVVAAGTNEPLIYPRHLAPTGPLILADLSVPSIVAPEVHKLAHVRTVPVAGTVIVPGAPDFAMASHIPQGTAFACAGESMLLALAPDQTAGLHLTGPIRSQSVDVLDSLAERFGLFGSRAQIQDEQEVVLA